MGSRREFLKTMACGALVGVTARPLSAAAGTTHIAPETGRFEPLVGPDIAAQLAYAAARGYRAFCDPDWLRRSDAERLAVVTTARREGLALGPIRAPWLPMTTSGIAPWETDLRRAIHVSSSAGIPALRVEIGPPQWSVWSELVGTGAWSAWADRAATVGVKLLWEPWDDGRAGPALLREMLATVARIDHPALRLSIDHHVWRAEPMLLATASRWTDLIRTSGDDATMTRLASSIGATPGGVISLPAAETAFV
jgi:hypothetical protein